MAKYLGGITDPDIEVTGISQHFFDSDFDVTYYDYKSDTLAVQKKSIAGGILRYEEVSAETKNAADHRLTGGLAGFLAGGPVWGAIGVALGTAATVTGQEKHVVLCELNNGWKFAVELDKNEFMAWQASMDAAVEKG